MLIVTTATDGIATGLVLGGREANVGGNPQQLISADCTFSMVNGNLEMGDKIQIPTGFDWKENAVEIVPEYIAKP